MISNELKVTGVPSSFVFNNMKLEKDAGSGESKLFIGPMKNEKEFDDFFEFGKGFSYKFVKDNLMEYLEQIKLEYVFQKINRYKKADESSWNEFNDEVKNLSNNDLGIDLTVFKDKSRYYVRADGDNTWKLFRKITIPKLTDVYFEKDTSKKEISIFLKINYSYEKDLENGKIAENTPRNHDGKNVILYGVPGAGKSHKIATEYCDDEERMQRVVFHPDYTYSDFVGQILPTLNENGKLEYKFTPGPFTSILKKAQYDPENTYYLIVEEINRGNAPAIFGEIFQLLDRYSEDDGKVSENPELLGWSEYGITNYDIAKEVYGDREHLVKIPSNLFIIATMNTADQNVFTLDTAFQRRWEMEHIPNDVDNCEYADEFIADTGITWRAFAEEANQQIIESNAIMGDSGDKRLGAYFVRVSELHDKKKFSEKVLKYLWDDALKMDRSKLFSNDVKSVDGLIERFEKGGSNSMKSVITEGAYNGMIEIAKAYNDRIAASAKTDNSGDSNETDE